MCWLFLNPCGLQFILPISHAKMFTHARRLQMTDDISEINLTGIMSVLVVQMNGFQTVNQKIQINRSQNLVSSCLFVYYKNKCELCWTFGRPAGRAAGVLLLVLHQFLLVNTSGRVELATSGPMHCPSCSICISSTIYTTGRRRSCRLYSFYIHSHTQHTVSPYCLLLSMHSRPGWTWTPYPVAI